MKYIDGFCPVCNSARYEPLRASNVGEGHVSLNVPYVPWGITLNVCTECGCVYLHEKYLRMMKEKRND